MKINSKIFAVEKLGGGRLEQHPLSPVLSEGGACVCVCGGGGGGGGGGSKSIISPIL